MIDYEELMIKLLMIVVGVLIGLLQPWWVALIVTIILFLLLWLIFIRAGLVYDGHNFLFFHFLIWAFCLIVPMWFVRLVIYLNLASYF